ncbi:MAG TPA: hypothetical protein VIE89_07365 [Candidatus Binatia bacterium]|jgi:hypothetical protein
MRKRITNQGAGSLLLSNQQWLNLEHLAQVEVSSEDAAHPIESALMPSAGPGWRAGQPGQQTVRLLFDEPQKVARIRLLFQEDEQQRTQQFVLRWSSDGGQSYRELVRQQYNFSPPGSTTECEDYTVDLDNVTMLELIIIPDISGVPVCASLAQLRLV